MRLSLRSIGVSTPLTALLAAGLLIWAQPALAADPPMAARAEPQGELSARSAAMQRARQAVLGVRTQAVEQARSARTLGRDRQGSGVLISPDGLVLTIAYLLLEADQVMLLREDGRSVPARVIGHDLASGLGLLQALAPLGMQPAPLGRPEQLASLDRLMVASGGPTAAVSVTELVARRAFTGYWEYHIDDALFTAPSRSDHSGAGLFNAKGELVGIGSLVLADVDAQAASAASAATRRPGNMFVPVNLLPAAPADLHLRGFGTPVQRAWLGLNCIEQGGQLRVLRVSDDSPADLAGLEAGDRILRIDGVAVQTLAALWQTLWLGGVAEREVLLEIERGQPSQTQSHTQTHTQTQTQTQTLKVYSVDRMKTLRRPEGI